MPKNPLKFVRRRSSNNLLDEAPTTPTASSFRVLERPEKINLNGETPTNGARPVTRPLDPPLVYAQDKSTDRLDVMPDAPGSTVRVSVPEWMLKGGRVSGGTMTSHTSTYYESSSASVRHSSISTLPSSVDADKDLDDDELFPRHPKTTSTFQDVPFHYSDPFAQPPSSTRTKQPIALEQRHGRMQPKPIDIPTPPSRPKNAARSPERHSSPRRQRAMTTSSYASTAKPDANTSALDSSDLDDDFGYMVSRPKSGNAWDGPLGPFLPSPVAAYHRTDSPPLFTPRSSSQSPVRGSPHIARDDTGSPLVWGRRGSPDRLMSESTRNSLARSSPPPPPLHRTGAAPGAFNKARDSYAIPTERYSSPAQEHYSQDSQEPFLPDLTTAREREPSKSPTRSAARYRLSPSAPQAEAHRNGARSPEGAGEEDGELFAAASRNATPRAAATARRAVGRQQQQDDSLFDSSPLGPPSRALRPQQQQQQQQQHRRKESETPRKMSKAQFERLRRREQEEASGGTSDDEDERALSEPDDYEDEDEEERAKQVARQRQRQEANMSVYRQQMKKVTGGRPADVSAETRPGIDRAASSTPPSLSSVHLGGIGGLPPADAARGKQSDDDDENVPLGILQAHGFPRSSRPSSRSGESDMANQPKTSPAPSVAAGGASSGSLPPFARKLPADPHMAGAVNGSKRNSLGPAHMMPQGPPTPPTGQPGGLVGVIVGEERAKAARRGSPTVATGGFGPAPLPVNMPQMVDTPGMQARSISMGSMVPPQAYLPAGAGQMPMMGMPMMQPMPMMPGQQDHQMQQFMQMQMELMQNMMAMQQQQQQQMSQTPPPAPQQQAQDPAPVPAGQTKRQSFAGAPSQATSAKSTTRPISMLNPQTTGNTLSGGQRLTTYAPSGLKVPSSGSASGYTPSIAPSERSNIGLPSRYRPVGTGSDLSDATMSSTASSANSQTNGARGSSSDTAKPKVMIKAIDKPKGMPKVANKVLPASDEDDEGWADMRKKREDKKRSRFGGKGKEISLDELVQNLK